MFDYQLDSHTTARLMQPDDAEAFFTLIDTHRTFIGRWIPWVDGVTVEERRQAIEQSANFPESGFCDVGIWCDGTLAGVVGLHSVSPTTRSATFHYYIAETFEGRGLITRTVQAMVNELFASGHYNRLVINVGTANVRSAAIPERLGFVREGVLRQSYAMHGAIYDLAVYGLLREEWVAMECLKKRLPPEA